MKRKNIAVQLDENDIKTKQTDRKLICKVQVVGTLEDENEVPNHKDKRNGTDIGESR